MAQETSVSDRPSEAGRTRLRVLNQCPNEIGIAGGVPTSYGLSYCRWLTDRFGLRTTFMAWYRKSGEGDRTHANLVAGVTGLYEIAARSQTRLVGHAGFHTRRVRDDGYLWEPANSGRYTASLGPGLIFSSTLSSFHLLSGFAFSVRDGYDGGHLLTPLIDAGVYFRF